MGNPSVAVRRAGPGLALGLGVVAVSSAAILISFARAQGLPALTIAALRMVFASAVVVPVALLRRGTEIRALPVQSILLAAGSGIFLALHFGFWVSSLDSTSVMSSVVLVSTNPLFVGLASLLIFRERPRAGALVGIGIAVLGAAAVALSDAGQTGPGSLRGDILALLGAVSASGYLLLGRRLRPLMPLEVYIGIAYPTAAAALTCAVAVSGARLFGYPLSGYLWAALIALGPQLIGHSSYNWALKYVSATLVAVTLLGEPVGATLLAIPILDQVPTGWRVAGGLMILAGIFLSVRGETRTTQAKGK